MVRHPRIPELPDIQPGHRAKHEDGDNTQASERVWQGMPQRGLIHTRVGWSIVPGIDSPFDVRRHEGGQSPENREFLPHNL